MTWPVVLFWVLFAGGLVSSGPLLIYLFFATAAFGSLAVVPIELVGGVNLLPQPIVAAAILARTLVDKETFLRGMKHMAHPHRLGVMSLFLGVCLITTLVMPVLFRDTVNVVSIAAAREGPTPLKLGTYNLTQMAYLTLSVGSVLAFALLAEQSRFEGLLRRSILVGGITLAATGLMAFAANTAGAPEALDAFRTVSYVLLTSDESVGIRRLVGLMPEASAFGALSVLYGAILIFSLHCWDGIVRALVLVTALTLFVLAAMSTSSTAYVGIGLCGLLFALNGLRRLLSIRARGRRLRMLDLALTAASAVGLLGLVLFAPGLIETGQAMIDVILFQKVNSSSYLERMQWNETALKAFWDTQGFGVGIGSARASNWFIALLSNAGLIGAALMAIFIVQTLIRSQPHDQAASETILAFKASLIIALALGALAGTSPDFGVGVGAIYGLIAGLSFRSHDATPSA